METHLAPEFTNTREGQEAEAILRTCVHCGFCTATCPTYQLLGDELDSPRGRIYLIKQVLEGATPTAKTQSHLDRCLTCRACESTCPSGVHYARLLDIGREIVERKVPRPRAEALMRRALREFIPRQNLFFPAMKLGQWVRPFMPKVLKAKVPALSSAGPVPVKAHPRTMIALAGCAQPAMYPNINGAARRVLDRLGITLIEPAAQACCGAVRHHLSATEAARDDARRNIDAWWPLIEAGAEAIVMTASGCGAHVREYGHLLQHDRDYASKATRVSTLTRDISEIIAAEQDQLLVALAITSAERPSQKSVARPEEVQVRMGRRIGQKIAVHNPCSLQHGMQVRGLIERVLTSLGAELTPVADSHLCCGSAGTYSILQPELSAQLKANKLTALNAGQPELIVSANVGCIAHLASEAKLPVKHWIELLDDAFHEN